MQISSRWQAMLCVVVLMCTQACTNTDLEEYYKRHSVDFKARTNYISHQVPRGQYTLRAREFGEPNDQPSIVLMHGFPDSMRLYDWLIPELMGDRHILAFDFLGWGDSDKPQGHRYDVASLKTDLEAVLATLAPESVVLVAHDASGQPALDWALQHPDKVAGLVLLNTYYGPMPSLKAPEAIELFSSSGLRRDVSVLLTGFSDALWLNRYNAQMAKFMSNQALHEPFQNILGYQSLGIREAFFGLNRVLLSEVAAREERQAALQEFNRPVRIIFGADDPYLNADLAREFHRLLPRSELFLIENAGHFVQVDQAKHVADLLRGFPE